MRMNREEFVRKYSTIFFEFDLSGCTELEYDHEIYDLTDGARLEELIRCSKEKKDYPVCKIANNILAVYEVENQTVHYRHTPVMMHIELSSFCDCECIMCRHCYEKNSSAKYLPRKSFYELAPYFAACRIVIINGYGEPFIHPHIAEIISAFEKYGIKLFTTTNIQHLPPGGPEQTNKVFARINVSCDGATAETYESIRRGASFDTFVKNVKLLREHCPDVQLFMSVVAMRQNIGEAVELVRLAKELGFEEIRFGRLGSNLFLGNEKDELIYYPNYASAMLEKAKREGEKTGVRVVTPVIMRGSRIDEKAAERERVEIYDRPFFESEEHYAELSEKYARLKELHRFEHQLYSTEGAISCRGLCHWIGFGLYVNSSGKVRPCSEVPYNREQERRQEIIDQNCSELKEFRRRFISGKVPKVCMDCAFIMSDEIGCLKVDLQEYKHYFQEKAGLTDERS